MQAFTITVLRQQRESFVCRADQTLLDGALQRGVALPYGCGAGKCALCRAGVEQGQFLRLETPVNKRLAHPGTVFLCCTRPLSDLVLSYPCP